VTNAEIARLLTEAIELRARAEAEAAQLVMLSFEYVSPAQSGEVDANVARRTRTLLFMEAELRAGDTLVARASSVHALS
jgi:acyl-coenzyme A thioesterase PaaI-like protein